MLSRVVFLCVVIVVVLVTRQPARPPDLRSSTPSATQSAGNPKVNVWVNTSSGVYHCPGTRWYGNTKRGEYMSQKEAQAKGYRPAQGISCG